jgi:hypothetical protein
MPTKLPIRIVPVPERVDIQACVAVILFVAVLVVSMTLQSPVPYEVVSDIGSVSAGQGSRPI